MSYSIRPTQRAPMVKTCGGVASLRTQPPCSLITGVWCVYCSRGKISADGLNIGYHDLHCNCCTLRVNFQPCRKGRHASFNEEDGDVRVCNGQYSGPPRHFHPPVPGPNPSRCCAPGRERRSAHDHDSSARVPTAPGRSRSCMEAGVEELKTLSPRGQYTYMLHNHYCCTRFRHSHRHTTQSSH